MEILILMTAVCSKKDIWLEKLGDCEDKLVNAYLSYVEKYIPLDSRNDESILNTSISMIIGNNYNNHNNSSIGGNHNNNHNHSNTQNSTRILNLINEKMHKKIEELEKEKMNLLKTVNNCEMDKTEEKNKYNKLENKIKEIEFQYKDSLRQIELNKISNNNSIQMKEEMLEESLNINRMKNLVESKYLEIEDLNSEIDLIKKFNIEEVNKLKEKLEKYEEKIAFNRNLSNDNDKLKNKIKELQLFKENQSQYDELVLSLESKSRIIDSLIKEKQGFISQNEKYTKDILQEKDKNRQTEYNMKKIDYDINELKNEKSKLENMLKTKDNQIVNLRSMCDYNIKDSNIHNSGEGNTTINKVQVNLCDLDSSVVGVDVLGALGDIDKTKEEKEKVRLLEKEIINLKTDKAKLSKNYKAEIDEVHMLSDDKEKLTQKIEDFSNEAKRFRADKEKYEFEKEKLDLKNQKHDIELQKRTLLIEKLEIEKKKFEDDSKDDKEKINKYNEQMILIKKEMDKCNKEKKDLQKEISSMTKDFDKKKNGYENQCKFLFLY